MSASHTTPVGGGVKKILYTLNTLRQIGLVKASKALGAHNTCKACALGMGGQRGGMVNELDEFPSVCNKSVQAQLTDIQPPIPVELFQEHPLADFKELSGKELEQLGRLNTPLIKKAGEEKYQPISWDEALAEASAALKQSNPEKTFFYSSGRSSNEAAFVMQLFARLYGSNHINNCSYYCHQATGVGLNSTVGQGTATIQLEDLGKSDLVFLIGANPASNHPRLLHQLKNLRERGGKIIVINPLKEPGLVKFAVPKSPKSLLIGGHEIASEYLQPKIGSDLLLLKGIAKALIEQDAQDQAFIDAFTASFQVYREDIEQTAWSDIEAVTGISQQSIEAIAGLYAKSSATIFVWGMGVTHHSNGVENVEAIANLAMLRGMLAKPGAGLLPLRGHSNVQGVGTVGVKPEISQQFLEMVEERFGAKLPDYKGMDTLSCLQAAQRGEIDAAFIMGGNLYEGSPDTKWAEQALDNIPTRICLTTTLNRSHVYGTDKSNLIIFPVTARDEEWESTTQESMFNYVRLSDGGINRLDNIKPEMHIITSLAEQVVSSDVQRAVQFERFNAHDYTRELIAESVAGMEQLKSIGSTHQEFHIAGRVLNDKESLEQRKALQFRVPESKKIPQLKSGFTLTTVRSEGQFNSIIYEEQDSYRAIPQRWAVLMSPDDMNTMGIKQADKVNIKSDSGEMLAVSVYAFDLPEGNLMAYYPEANLLVGQEHDQRSKTPAFKSVSVSLEAL